MPLALVKSWSLSRRTLFGHGVVLAVLAVDNGGGRALFPLRQLRQRVEGL